MPPSAPFLTWSPILLPPWGPAFLPAALYPAALRSALPGFVINQKQIFYIVLLKSKTTKRKPQILMICIHFIPLSFLLVYSQ